MKSKRFRRIGFILLTALIMAAFVAATVAVTAFADDGGNGVTADQADDQADYAIEEAEPDADLPDPDADLSMPDESINGAEDVMPVDGDIMLLDASLQGRYNVEYYVGSDICLTWVSELYDAGVQINRSPANLGTFDDYYDEYNTDGSSVPPTITIPIPSGWKFVGSYDNADLDGSDFIIIREPANGQSPDVGARTFRVSLAVDDYDQIAKWRIEYYYATGMSSYPSTPQVTRVSDNTPVVYKSADVQYVYLDQFRPYIVGITVNPTNLYPNDPTFPHLYVYNGATYIIDTSMGLNNSGIVWPNGANMVISSDSDDNVIKVYYAKTTPPSYEVHHWKWDADLGDWVEDTPADTGRAVHGAIVFLSYYERSFLNYSYVEAKDYLGNTIDTYMWTDDDTKNILHLYYVPDEYKFTVKYWYYDKDIDDYVHLTLCRM